MGEIVKDCCYPRLKLLPMGERFHRFNISHATTWLLRHCVSLEAFILVLPFRYVSEGVHYGAVGSEVVATLLATPKHTLRSVHPRGVAHPFDFVPLLCALAPQLHCFASAGSFAEPTGTEPAPSFPHLHTLGLNPILSSAKKPDFASGRLPCPPSNISSGPSRATAWRLSPSQYKHSSFFLTRPHYEASTSAAAALITPCPKSLRRIPTFVHSL